MNSIDPRRIDRPSWKILASVFLVAAVVRIAAVAIGYSSLPEDPDSYARLAIALAKTGTFGLENADGVTATPSAYRPPFYPWLISWCVVDGRLSLTALAGLHVVLGILSVFVAARVGRDLGLGQARWWAALLLAFDPLLLRASTQVMTESLATLMALVILALFQFATGCSPAQSLALQNCGEKTGLLRDRSACTHARNAIWYALKFVKLGFASGLFILTRPTAALWILVIGFVVLTMRHQHKSFRYIAVAAMGLACGAVLLPWTVRNYYAFGKPIWSTTHGGYTLLLANNPLLYEHFRTRGPSREWDADDFHRHWLTRHVGDPTGAAFWSAPTAESIVEPALDEVADDNLAYRAAQATIYREPATFAISCVYRTVWFWATYPNRSGEISGPAGLAARLLIGAWYCVWLALAMAAAIRLGRGWLAPGWLVAAGLIVSLTAIHAVYWSNMRMRAPAMPVIYFLAATSLPIRRP